MQRSAFPRRTDKTSQVFFDVQSTWYSSVLSCWPCCRTGNRAISCFLNHHTALPACRPACLPARPHKGVETRLQDPSMQSDASRKADLRRGLVPSLPPVGDQTRAALGTEQKAHQQECEEREARWDAELADTLTTAEEVRQKLETRTCIHVILRYVGMKMNLFLHHQCGGLARQYNGVVFARWDGGRTKHPHPHPHPHSINIAIALSFV